MGATFRLAPLSIFLIFRVSLSSLYIPGTTDARQCNFHLNPIDGSPDLAIKRHAPTTGGKPGATPDRRAWKQVLRNGTGSTRAAGSQYSQPLMPRFTRTCRRNVSTPGAQIIARTRTPKKHSAPGCWSPRRVAPAAERCSNAILECRVYRRFAVTSQSKLPWTSVDVVEGGPVAR